MWLDACDRCRSAQASFPAWRSHGLPLHAGMAADESIAQRIKRSGVGLLQPTDGLAGLHTIMAALADPHAASAQVAAVPVDWQVLLRATPGRMPAFFADVTAGLQLPSAEPAGAAGRAKRGRGPARSRRRAGAPAHTHTAAAVSEEAVRSAVVEATTSILGAEVSPAQPLMEAGLDSLGKQGGSSSSTNGTCAHPSNQCTRPPPSKLLQVRWSCAMLWEHGLAWSFLPPSSLTTPAWQRSPAT